jgi:2'-5' RNA ligase
MLNKLVTSYLTRQAGIPKRGTINFDPKQTFFYVPLPKEIQDKYSQLGKELFGDEAAEVNDHITLLYLPKQDNTIPQQDLDKILKMLNNISMPQINATVQGWAYFDGADGKEGTKTALVALIDTPGLEELHVSIKNGMKSLGYNVTQNHGFNPHTTFCYLPRGQRADNLPVLADTFTIDKFCMASDKNYNFNLKG